MLPDTAKQKAVPTQHDKKREFVLRQLDAHRMTADEATPPCHTAWCHVPSLAGRDFRWRPIITNVAGCIDWALQSAWLASKSNVDRAAPGFCSIRLHHVYPVGHNTLMPCLFSPHYVSVPPGQSARQSFNTQVEVLAAERYMKG